LDNHTKEHDNCDGKDKKDNNITIYC
jgi:hypothetical protein